MTASYADLGQIAQQTEFLNRVRCALFQAAIAAYNEGSGATGHAARAAFATKVLNGQYDLSAASNAVLTNSTIISEAIANQSGNGVPDSDLQFVMNSVYNGLAGA